MNATRKKAVPAARPGVASTLQTRFRSFSQLAERAGEGRPLLRGLRVARDPKADRFVVVHAGARVEFAVVPAPEADPTLACVECRGIDTAGRAEANPLARFSFGEDGIIAQSTIPELANVAIDQVPAAWSVVAAVLWQNMHERDPQAP